MILEKFVVGALETNCYVFGDDGSKEAVVIDPGGECQRIKDFIALHGLRLINVINTHGHGDHIICNGELGAAVLIHELDRDFLENPHLNLSMAFGARITSPKAGGCLLYTSPSPRD